MAKKQKRRSISVRGDIYEKVHAHCKIIEQSMSSFVEDRITNFLEHGEQAPKYSAAVAQPVKQPEVREARKPIEKSSNPPPPVVSSKRIYHLTDDELQKEVQQYFTF
jgi:hypothetical protein